MLGYGVTLKTACPGGKDSLRTESVNRFRMGHSLSSLQAVIANLLGRHRTTVTVVTRESDGSKVITKLELSPDELERGTELEERIVSELVRKHNVI